MNILLRNLKARLKNVESSHFKDLNINIKLVYHCEINNHSVYLRFYININRKNIFSGCMKCTQKNV